MNENLGLLMRCQKTTHRVKEDAEGGSQSEDYKEGYSESAGDTEGVEHGLVHPKLIFVMLRHFTGRYCAVVFVQLGNSVCIEN
jgi:hypothetical protein